MIMRTRMRVTKRVARRVPIVEVYGVPDAGRFLNVALLHATPEIDVGAMQEGAWKRFVARTKKKVP